MIKEGLIIPILEGKRIGTVDVEVYETLAGEIFFYIQGSNKRTIPILDYLENSLENY